MKGPPVSAASAGDYAQDSCDWRRWLLWCGGSASSYTPNPRPDLPLKTRSTLFSLGGFALAASLAPPAHGQIAYGVNSGGSLFSIDLASPGAVTSIGSLGFVPEAIDFRPGTATLYAIDVNSTTGASALYTVNTVTGATTIVGSGFTATELVGATSIGFDFNPTTLQNDGSIRIRLVAGNGANLRLNSDTGLVSNTDTALNGVTGAVVTAAAYTRTDFASIGAVPTGTALYYIDSANNSLLTTSNPNAGALSTVGALGVDVGTNIGFDIFTGGSTNTGYIVDSFGAGQANLYTVNLTTGALSGSTLISSDFTGGFAITQVPEPASAAALAGLVALGLVGARRRRTA